MQLSTTTVEFLTARQVRARFGGASAMWLYRRITRDGFPAPVSFGSRLRYFSLAEIESWERRHLAHRTPLRRPGATDQAAA